jgi:hypothetical protein
MFTKRVHFAVAFSSNPAAPSLVKESPTNMSRRTGDEVIIDCPVDAYPKPSVAWYKNGLALSVGLGTRWVVFDHEVFK